MKNEWCYEHFWEKTKPKGLFKKLYYWFWEKCGINPGELHVYVHNKTFNEALIELQKRGFYFL